MSIQIPIPKFHAPDAEFQALISADTQPIGRGSTRIVYPIDAHSDKVLKVAISSNGANWVEAVVFSHLEDNALFGNILSVSQSGKFLVMERLDDVPPSDVAGMEVPHWWTDKKPENFGRSPTTGRIKIRDYALVKLNLNVLVPMPSEAENKEMAGWMRLMNPSLAQVCNEESPSDKLK